MHLKVTVNGEVYDVEVEVEEQPPPSLAAIFTSGFQPAGGSGGAAPTPVASSATDGEGVRAPLSGTVARILVHEGQEVAAGDVVVVLEAMKMETEINAPSPGVVAAIRVASGEVVSGGQVLVEIATGGET